MQRRVWAAALAAILALGACEGSSRHQEGDADQQGAGQAPEAGQGTIANDTAPARPGTPTPQEVTPADAEQVEKQP